MNSDSQKLKPVWKGISIAAILLLVAICSLAVGVFWERQAANKKLEIELNSVQATLTYNRIASEKKVQVMLSQGCVAEVAKQAAIDEDQDTALLAEMFKGKIAPWARQYIIVRDPELVRSLQNFRSKYETAYLTPVCKNRKRSSADATQRNHGT